MGCGGSKSAEGHLVWQIAEIPTNPNQLGCFNFFQVFAVFWLKLMFDWPFWQVHWPDPASAPSSAPKAERNAESMSTAAATSGTAEGLSWLWSLLHSFVISDLGLQNDWSKAEKDRKLNDCRWLRMQCWRFSKFGICSLHIIAQICVLRGVVVPSVFLQFYHFFALQQAFSQMILRALSRMKSEVRKCYVDTMKEKSLGTGFKSWGEPSPVLGRVGNTVPKSQVATWESYTIV